ncbi:hypothetical protein HRI_003874200 [Hibiscus trionum]|uniref:PB1-like domain-containing protein n=1 Tax=Hibiscus trionum TaxID=183268 RepID=A0A9W7MJI2_HIBTR|nr:hypothetical protein HRI_003874200 [Hibiscus trionum]
MAETSNVFVLQYYHGGKFVTSPKFAYIGGSCEKLQIDPDTLCYWDIICNAKDFGYEDDPWVYYRVPGVEFNSDALVLVHDDNTVRQYLGYLNIMGIVDLYVGQKNNYEAAEKSTEVGEDIENINELVVDDLGAEDTGGAEVVGDAEDTGGGASTNLGFEIEDLGHDANLNDVAVDDE